MYPYMPWVQAHSIMARAEGLKADKHTCGGESLMEHKDQEDESKMFTWFISQKDEKGVQAWPTHYLQAALLAVFWLLISVPLYLWKTLNTKMRSLISWN